MNKVEIIDELPCTVSCTSTQDFFEIRTFQKVMLFLILVKSLVIQIHDIDILYRIFCLRGFLQLKPWISEMCVSEIYVPQGHV